VDGDRRIVELDGLRGMAALSVVLAHYFGEVNHRIGMLDLGWVGVILFFVLSGFLVGGILMDNRDAPRFFSAFYARRAFRIFPIYYLVVCLALAFSDATRGSPWSDAHFDPLVYAAYAQNIAATLYGPEGKVFQPLWTLAVEEQFYLLAPVFIFFCPPRLLARAVLALILMAPFLRAAMVLTLPYP
jgi:peptidoglycan/LPS O-acetylase OafA/YrhL